MKKYLYFLLFVSISVSAQNASEIYFGSNTNIGEYADINGIKMYYDKYGKGEPLLLLHGGTGSIEDYKYIIPYLSKDFQVIAVDFRGHGRTNNNIDSMSYSLHTSDIIHFIEFLRLEELRIIGYSDGGVVALKLAIEIPEKIKKMVVVGANKSVSDLENYIIDFANEMTSDENMSNSYIKSQKDKYIKMNPEPDKYEKFMQLVGQMWLREPYITNDDYAIIKTPILLIYGDRDLIKFDKMIQMYKDLKDDRKQLCILPNTDHFVFQENHSEIVNPIILKYLKMNN